MCEWNLEEAISTYMNDDDFTKLEGVSGSIKFSEVENKIIGKENENDKTLEQNSKTYDNKFSDSKSSDSKSSDSKSSDSKSINSKSNESDSDNKFADKNEINAKGDNLGKNQFIYLINKFSKTFSPFFTSVFNLIKTCFQLV
ncbi:uncharacterized protein LOC111533056, partial [Piliocolobus tephrosceles]|uniref:uncharacterized protein LOC111533056 n=1 Tax=Piliocolobus tephrosceles TaxID=591936 RepID=UPI000C2B3903